MSFLTFGIKLKQLEKIISYCKSLTFEYENLKYFKENNISELLSKLNL